MDKELYNESWCKDETAYKAVKNIRREERRKLIVELKSLAEKYGYEITSTIKLKPLE